MARNPRLPQDVEPPADWTPTQAVDEPVINNPYDEPTQHWVYQGGVPQKVPGRRPAGYWYKTKKTGAAQQQLWAEEERDDLPLVNRLRADVARWRKAEYRGASQVTKDLLLHWTSPDRVRRLFFCQREAVETIIYLLELAIPGRLRSTGFQQFGVDATDLDRLLRGEKPGFDLPERQQDFYPRLVDVPEDPGLLPLRRLGCKMATGSGKTLVMAMLITWAFCNRGRNPATTTFPNAVLVCAPNLTVRKRLQVLRPESPENFYDAFDLVPAKYRELMGGGKVLVTNWHTFALKSPNREGDASYRVVDKGEETPEAFTKDRLGELAARLPILVLNDEGHHCWRPKSGAPATAAANGDLSAEERKALEEEREEARVWLAGLDRINSSGLLGSGQPCVLACIDLSATPFYLANSGYPEGSPFPWLVSDFGLVDAIECGIVKIPRLPVRDDTAAKDEVGRPDPKYYRLWRHINDSLAPTDRVANGRPKPEAVYREAEGALQTLAAQWKTRFDDIRAKSPGEAPVPPVLIVVCDNTEIAEVFYRKISGERVVEVPSEDGNGTVKKVVYEGSAVQPELANSDEAKHTLRIDSELLKKIETEEGETRDEAGKALREIINTVGKRGFPGEHVRCVVSVSMLTEGWDATNVTHILGVRAFASQLLCEQVVGRGLRRMSYTPDPETGLLSPEHVDVYGIPFSLIPFKGRPKDTDGTDPVYHHIFAVPERASLEIRVPVVDSYTYDVQGCGITCDVESLEGFVVQDEPTEVYLAPTRGYQDEAVAPSPGEFVRQNRQEFYRTVRFQQVVFRLAQLIVEDLVHGAGGASASDLRKAALAKHQLFPEVVQIVRQYVDRKVTFAPGVDHRELALERYAKLLRDRVRDGILPRVAGTRLLPIVNSYHPVTSTAEVNYRTTRPVVELTKSHLNLASVRSEWEREAIAVLEDLDFVEAFAPNDRGIGFFVPYTYNDVPALYEPDFIVRLRGGRLVMLEIKGRAGEIHDQDRVLAKNAAARKWVAAVNNAGRYGQWVFEICKEVPLLRSVLQRHVQAAFILPFRSVQPGPGDRFRTCVPLVSLRAAAGRWSQEQQGLEQPGEWAEDWVTYETRTRFEPGMFVARVQGDSMAPEIADGAYCLFRQPRAGSRQGRKLLVWHSGIADPHTGGQYTLKVYTSEKARAGDGDWQHTRIVLKPLNPAHQPIVLTPADEGEVRVIAEFVEVVG